MRQGPAVWRLRKEAYDSLVGWFSKSKSNFSKKVHLDTLFEVASYFEDAQVGKKGKFPAFPLSFCHSVARSTLSQGKLRFSPLLYLPSGTDFSLNLLPSS